MERAHRLTACELHVPLIGLRQQPGAVLKRDDRVHLRIDPLDVIEIGDHDLDA
jgi:hypothetical protein